MAPHLRATLATTALILFQTQISTTQTLPALNHFDFVIIGGGTSGLAVANRLSELAKVTVAVIEAGKDEQNNPNVTSLMGFGLTFDTPVDWQYETVEQIYAANQVVDYHAGKALGGTSVMNGMTYIRAEDVQIDAWETLGNRGWNWDNIYPYYLKSERFQPPTKAQISAGASYVDSFHGRDGPLTVGYPYGLLNGSFASVARETWRNLGFPWNRDVNGGKMRGFFGWPQTLDRAANIREDAARAYYYPVEGRENLVVFRGTANRITWVGSGNNLRERADGVEYTMLDGVVNTIYADKEVIVSAGAIRSPAILELSGVGNPEILGKHGITVKIPLSSVGENAQEQPNTSIIYSSISTFNGTAPYVTYATASDIFGSDTKAVADSTAASLETWARLAVQASTNNAVLFTAIKHQFQIQHDLIFKQNVPCIEVLTTVSGSDLVSAFWTLLPFSRGNVHINSADPHAYPLINPNYFMVDWDLTMQRKIAEMVVQFWDTAPVRSLVVERISPPLSTLPGNATNEQWMTWIKSSFSANHHLLGTAAMLPEELGGVVDNTLTVYGTENVRVIDASILPAQVSGHLTSTLYAVAEWAADLIKQGLDRATPD